MTSAKQRRQKSGELQIIWRETNFRYSSHHFLLVPLCPVGNVVFETPASCGSQAASRPSFSRARKAQPHSATPGQSQSSQNSSTPTKSA
ncbi:hypothetical protein LEMLEM_LOCUS18537 [Lemmus lemmus]